MSLICNALVEKQLLACANLQIHAWTFIPHQANAVLMQAILCCLNADELLSLKIKAARLVQCVFQHKLPLACRLRHRVTWPVIHLGGQRNVGAG